MSKAIIKGVKATSYAIVLTASLVFWALGLGTTIDLIAGAKPVVCQKYKEASNAS